MKTPKTLDRDLSWIYFNHRILQEAQRANVPLLERLSFLGIYSNNLDEFFRVRVSTMKRVAEYESGRSPGARRELREINRLIPCLFRRVRADVRRHSGRAGERAYRAAGRKPPFRRSGRLCSRGLSQRAGQRDLSADPDAGSAARRADRLGRLLGRPFAEAYAYGTRGPGLCADRVARSRISAGFSCCLRTTGEPV